MAISSTLLVGYNLDKDSSSYKPYNSTPAIIFEQESLLAK